MFLHSFEDLVGLDDVGVGPDVVVGLVDVFVFFYQAVAFVFYYLGKNSMGVENLQDSLQFFPLDQRRRYLVDLSLPLVLFGP